MAIPTQPLPSHTKWYIAQSKSKGALEVAQTAGYTTEGCVGPLQIKKDNGERMKKGVIQNLILKLAFISRIKGIPVTSG